jgi:hypothetical protein
LGGSMGTHWAGKNDEDVETGDNEHLSQNLKSDVTRQFFHYVPTPKTTTSLRREEDDYDQPRTLHREWGQSCRERQINLYSW